MSEALATFYEHIVTPPPLSVALFLLGIYCLTTAGGVTTGIQLGAISIPSPTRLKWKLLLGFSGLALLVLSVTLALKLPVYKPSIYKKLIYDGDDAKQIVADGEDVYVLRDNGNIHRVSQRGLQLIDDGTGTKQIAPAGGVLYILKNNGNIWSYQPSLGRARQAFERKDVGTGTKQIVSAGETLYILKENGNIWKYFTRPVKGNVGDVMDEFTLIDGGTNTRQISSSGSVLYILKESGMIWEYIPTLKQPFRSVPIKGTAQYIEADAVALYFIKNDGTTWKYKRGESIVYNEKVATKIDALGGIVYMLTNEGEIRRYNSQGSPLRELTEAGSDNRDIAAYGQDIFVIKTNGSVWRYNEFILKR